MRKKRKKTIAFTNGCFDILHLGHIRYLKKIKSFADILIVGINSDKSVRVIKGESRPINPQKARVEVLEGLKTVDRVIVFDEPTPLKLIQKIKPDYLVKGADWKAGQIVGKQFVESYGGKVVTVPFIKGYSTSKIIEKIKRKKNL